METNKKIMMWLDAQEHPEQFTDDELRQMLDDPEIGALMEATAQGKRALMKQLMDQQSPKSVPNSLKSKVISLKYQKLAASFIGLLLISGIAFAAFRFVRSSEVSTAEVSQQSPAVEAHVTDVATLPADTTVEASPVVFDNVSLDSILSQIARHYGYAVDFRSDQTKGLRLFLTWNPQDSIQYVTDKLNLFEQINIVIDRRTIIVE